MGKVRCRGAGRTCFERLQFSARLPHSRHGEQVGGHSLGGGGVQPLQLVVEAPGGGDGAAERGCVLRGPAAAGRRQLGRQLLDVRIVLRVLQQALRRDKQTKRFKFELFELKIQQGHSTVHNTALCSTARWSRH